MKILIILTIACFYGIYDFLIKIGASKINPFLGGFFCQLVSAITILVSTLIFKENIFRQNPSTEILKGFVYVSMAGFLIGIGLIALLLFLENNENNISVVYPSLISLRSIIVIILGFLILREKITPQNILGSFLILAGINFILK